ncbi:uncharacterized protein LOC119066778 [Bradysia coprophila]|uniref:uncharacterized protein LOC119066778 n=1 Tax=Bradysia coprophila TaxID=38358 RepID=UPI00187DD118|nr:uncharacterized protein LOC119066778 [Bradysia coprophila]
MIIQLFSIYFCALVLSANAAVSFVPGCDCQNPTYIDQPDNIVQCWSKLKFYNQIDENFALQYGFLDQGTAMGCNYTDYRKAVDDFKTASKHIVDTYFGYKKSDCEPAVYSGLDNWKKLLTDTFYPFMACTYVYYPPECAVNIKHSVYFSAENLVTTLVECARLKRTSQRPDFRLLVNELLFKKPFECNCMKIDPRPIPVSEEQCYSAEYFSTVKSWISDNFRRVKETFNNASKANPECNYSEFIQNAIGLEERTNEWITILQCPSPTFEQLNLFRAELLEKGLETNKLTRNYVLEQPKKCYFTPRQLRQSALTISHYIIQILSKCVSYKDAQNSYC